MHWNVLDEQVESLGLSEVQHGTFSSLTIQ